MPSLSRRFLATAAVCLLAGVLLGFVLLVERDLGGRWPGPLAISAHAHLILVGAVLEAILGTGLWLFPRPRRDRWQAPGWVAELAWAALTAGTAIRAVAELAQGAHASGIARGSAVVGGALQVVGIAAGVVALQPRIRASIATPAEPR